MSYDALKAPADFYVEQYTDSTDPAMVRAQEWLNSDLNISDRGIHVLRQLSRLRLVKSQWVAADEIKSRNSLDYQDIGMQSLAAWHTQLGHSQIESNFDEVGQPVAPVGIRGLRKTLNTYITPTAGRQVFFSGPDWQRVLGFRMPQQVYDSNSRYPEGFTLSAKGNGSAFFPLDEQNLRNDMHILGITGYDSDFETSGLLVEGMFEVVDLHGDLQYQTFVPGRYPIAAEPLLHLRVITNDGSAKVLHPYSRDFASSAELQKRYPLLSGLDKPHVLFFANWCAITYSDLSKLARLTQPLPSHGLSPRLSREAARTQLVQAFGTIHHDLYLHPHFHEAFRHINPESMTEGQFMAAMLAAFVMNESNRNWMESQIVGAKGLVLPHRHSQNCQFGGQKDFGGSYLISETYEYKALGRSLSELRSDAVTRYYHESQLNLMRLLIDLAPLLDPAERTGITSTVRRAFDYAGPYAVQRRIAADAVEYALLGSNRAFSHYGELPSLMRNTA